MVRSTIRLQNHAGCVLTISIEPTIEFNIRSGMASSTRSKAIELWNTELPTGDKEKLAKMLFTYENSQDALGVVFPGLNKHLYNGDYWPKMIESVTDEETLQWIEERLFLVNLGPRTATYNALDNTHISLEGARALADAADACWEAIHARDAVAFGKAFRESFEAQIEMFPNMVTPDVLSQIDMYKDKALGWKLSGAGGGGYIILVSEKPVDNTIRIKIHRPEF